MTSKPQNSTDPTAVKTAFGAVVLARRIAAGLNRELFARMAGVGASHVGRIESGDVAPSIVTVRKIAEALGTTSGDLLDEADERLRRDGGR